MVGVAALAAGTVLVGGFQAEIRSAYGLQLPVRAGSLREACEIALNNVRVTALPLAAAIVVSRHPRLRLVADSVLVVLLVVNAVLVGAAVGGYGFALARAIVVHGMLELTAFSLVGAVYLQARRAPLGLAHVVPPAVLAWLVLIVAAAFETLGA
jgi:hypothetical protein